MLIFLCVFKNFKNSYIEIVKNINPINLELGHIAKDLNVGDKNIVKESNSNIFFSILENFNTKDL
tara:strand:+ start:164 stop:358 length:195 start_codon:yes stop_codon:yes gene_type:complete